MSTFDDSSFFTNSLNGLKESEFTPDAKLTHAKVADIVLKSDEGLLESAYQACGEWFLVLAMLECSRQGNTEFSATVNRHMSYDLRTKVQALHLLESLALDLAIRYADEPYVLVILKSTNVTETLNKQDCLRLAEAEMIDALQLTLKHSSSNPSAVHPEPNLNITGDQVLSACKWTEAQIW
jgi:hypothetical protein